MSVGHQEFRAVGDGEVEDAAVGSGHGAEPECVLVPLPAARVRHSGGPRGPVFVLHHSPVILQWRLDAAKERARDSHSLRARGGRGWVSA